MDYSSEVCKIFDLTKSKSELFISKTHKGFYKRRHIKLTFENPDINNIVHAFYAYNIQHRKLRLLP